MNDLIAEARQADRLDAAIRRGLRAHRRNGRRRRLAQAIINQQPLRRLP